MGLASSLLRRPVIQPRRNLSFVLSILVFTLLVLCVPTMHAQSAAKEEPNKTSTTAARQPSLDASPDANTDERLRSLEEEVRQQKQMLNELREIIADQRRLIEHSGPRADPARTTAANNAIINSDPVAAEASAQNQTPPLEDRVKKLEGKVLSIGPFRFSGDFRFRFDGIFRKADATPPTGFTPLTHQQNARMR